MNPILPPAPCPCCKQRLVAVNVGPVEVDVCKLGCKGIWFDFSELPMLFQLPMRQLTIALGEAYSAPPRFRSAEGLKCPRCQKTLRPMFYGSRGVGIDGCAACGGYFLDAGELQVIYEGALAVEPAAGAAGLGELAPEMKTRYSWRAEPARPAELPERYRPPALSRYNVEQQNRIDSVLMQVLLPLSTVGKYRRSTITGGLMRSVLRWL